MKGLTRRQQEVLEFIESFIRDKSFPPSVRDVTHHFKLASAAGAHKHIKALVAKGYLVKDDFLSRSLRLVRNAKPRRPAPERSLMELPLLGVVAAGRPIEAVQHQESISIPQLAPRRRGAELFALRVRGDSMIDEGIWDGDIVILEQRDAAENGETVVALINGEEVTLKRWFRENGGVRLQPANAAMRPIVISNGDVKVQGVVVGLYRNYLQP